MRMKWKDEWKSDLEPENFVPNLLKQLLDKKSK